MSKREMERNVLPKYNQHVCNVADCDNPIYRSGMCKEHYEFYMSSLETARVINEMEMLKSGNATWALKFKRVLHWICHLTMNIPMTLYEHFPLEHIFIAELSALRKGQCVDPERAQKVIRDFDVPENQNIATMKNLLDNRDTENLEILPKEEYYLAGKDLPIKWLPLISIIGVLGFCGFYIYLPDYDIQIFDMSFANVKLLSLKLAPYIISLAVFVMAGLCIPYRYNSFISKCYGLTLFNKLKDNIHVLNQIKFVKERQVGEKGYYASFIAFVLGAITIYISNIGYADGGFKWELVLLATSYIMTVIPIMYAFYVLALYYPVMNAFKNKRIRIDLYNSDHRGGLKQYHGFLFLIFIYNQGFSVVLLKIMDTLPMPLGAQIILWLIRLMRLKYAGMAIINWSLSIKDFYTAKHVEEERLTSLPGSVENMNLANALNKISPFALIPYVIKVIILIVIPYFINQLPSIEEALIFLGLK